MVEAVLDAELFESQLVSQWKITQDNIEEVLNATMVDNKKFITRMH